MEVKKIAGEFEETGKFQRKYWELLSMLDKAGTKVLEDTVKESDVDIAPHLFYRRSVCEYVFPQQDVKLQEENKDISNAPGYLIRGLKAIAHFDESAVRGRVRISYSDADNIPKLQISEVLRNSVLPTPLEVYINKLFSKE